MAVSLHVSSIFKGRLLSQMVPKVLLSEWGEDVWMELEWGLGSPHRGCKAPHVRTGLG